MTGGSERRDDSSTSEFAVIWYPGKNNTLTFNGNVGKQAKECLIELYTISGGPPNSSIDYNKGLANLNLEIKILKSRVGSMQSLMNPQENTKTPRICELHNEIMLLKIDLEEE